MTPFSNAQIVRETLENGRSLIGGIPSINPSYPYIYLWLWRENNSIYLAHGTNDRFGTAITQEVPDYECIGSVLNEIVQETIEAVRAC